MPVKVLVPTVLQKFTNDQAVLECSGSNISELFDYLEVSYPNIKGRLRKPEGEP
jgi:molybdopterin converting factor small subunit